MRKSFLALILLAGCTEPVAEQTESVADRTANQAAPVDLPGPAVAPNAPIELVAKDASAGPAGLDDYTWTFSDHRFPVLIYGMRHSDEIVINLQCRERGTVTILQMRQGKDPAAKRPILLRSDAEEVSLPIAIGQRDADDVFTATATLPVDHPLLSSFRASGRLSVPNEGRARRADAIDEAERAIVERFFQACSA